MEEETFGNKLKTKQSNTLRTIFMNINSIPSTNNSPKNSMLFQSIEQLEGDIVGFTEVKRFWPIIESNHWWYNRTKG